MKRILTFTAVIILLLACYLPTTAVAQNYLLNNYFGVNLTVDPTTHFFNMPWDPTRGYGSHLDWGSDGNMCAPDPGPSYYISEVFDIEGMYLDIDWTNEQIVYSIVTSMPTNGFDQVSWYPGYVFRAGDIRFNVGSEQYVVGTHESFTGNLYHNPTMSYRDGYRGFAERGNPTLANINIGSEMTTSSNFAFSYQEYLDANGNSVIENGYKTYIMEGKLSFSDIGGAPNAPIGMTLGMSCNNDVATTSVPEPGTLALMGVGLAGLIGGRRRFKK
jgi:hypothetical protein